MDEDRKGLFGEGDVCFEHSYELGVERVPG